MMEAAFSWLVGKFLDWILRVFKGLTRSGSIYNLLQRFQTRLQIDRLFSHERQEIGPEDTQHGMNTVAWSDVEIAKATLEKELNRLRLRLDSAECEKLQAAQDAWQEFAEKEIDFRTLGNEGGSIRPLLLAGEMSQLLLDRTAEIREQIEWTDKIE